LNLRLKNSSHEVLHDVIAPPRCNADSTLQYIATIILLSPFHIPITLFIQRIMISEVDTASLNEVRNKEY